MASHSKLLFHSHSFIHLFTFYCLIFFVGGQQDNRWVGLHIEEQSKQKPQGFYPWIFDLTERQHTDHMSRQIQLCLNKAAQLNQGDTLAAVDPSPVDTRTMIHISLFRPGPKVAGLTLMYKNRHLEQLFTSLLTSNILTIYRHGKS